MGRLEEVADRSLGVIICCDQAIERLIPQSGRDEGRPKGKFNKGARRAVAALFRQLAALGLGDLAATIRIGRISTAREAIGVLTKWRNDLQSARDNQQNGTPFESPPAAIDELVTLDQVAPLAGLAKRTLERYLRKGDLPYPDVRGGGGRAHKWFWANLRDALAKVARRQLPERFPASRII